ncbi:MAG: hypothetical protein M3Q97_07860 [Bacteroidota bacterium]|nr:hypothetical protein [Bacteroidota bacterium]
MKKNFPLLFLVVSCDLLMVSCASEKANLKQPKFTEMITRVWRIEGFEDSLGKFSRIDTMEAVTQDRILFFRDGRMIVVGGQSATLTWVYDDETHIMRVIDVDAGRQFNQEVLRLNDERIVIKTPQGVIHMVPSGEDLPNPDGIMEMEKIPNDPNSTDTGKVDIRIGR